MPVFINEVHYDNSGRDSGEFIEVAGRAGTALAGWRLILYNGKDGRAYSLLPLQGFIDDELNGFGAVAFPAAGIQNGAPDGIALVDDIGRVRELLSYEGSFTALDGAAAGRPSAPLPVFEPGGDPPGLSLQRTGAGPGFESLQWVGPFEASPNVLNAGERLALAPVPLPPTLWTLLAGLGVLGLTRRGRFRAGRKARKSCATSPFVTRIRA